MTDKAISFLGPSDISPNTDTHLHLGSVGKERLEDCAVVQEKQSEIQCLGREGKILYLLIKGKKNRSQGNEDETIEMILLETLVTVRLQCNIQCTFCLFVKIKTAGFKYPGRI